MDKYEKVYGIILQKPQQERQRLNQAILKLKGKRYVTNVQALNVACDILLAQEGTRKKKESDRRTDHRRRVLVGARVSREFAEQCRREAEYKGISLYAWVCDTLEQAINHPLR